VNVPHARVVYEHHYGAIPDGVHVHHRDGKSTELHDDRPDNLLLLDPNWNRRLIPVLAEGFNTTQGHVTDAYVRLRSTVSESELFAAICRELLQTFVS